MITIAITGHRPDAFLVSHYLPEEIQRIASDIVAIFHREHGDDLCFNLGGALGTDLWVGQACLEQNVKFRLYLPSLPQVQSKYWKDEQRKMLDDQMKRAVGIDIVNPSGYYDKKDYQVRNINMVDSANFVVAFWVGKRAGGTYNCMKYTLSKSKFVFNALNELKPVFKLDLENGWTPSWSQLPSD
jgi:uncharacterized phage-like protein YoqJ